MNNHQQICLVTGASSGIGKEIAIALATAGKHVVIVCRHGKKGLMALEEIKTRSKSGAVDLLMADLSSQADIRSLVETIYNRYSQLDVVINNAGLVSSKKTISVDGIEMTLATNHLGPFLLNNLLIDLLKKSGSARIINISSAIHRWAKMDLNDLQYDRRKYHFMKAYAQSKLLMTMATFELARSVDGTGITVNCLHPGAVKTSLGSNSANNIVLKLVDKAIKYFFITPAKAAKWPVYLATAAEMQNITGKYFAKGKVVSANSITADLALAKKVWEISEKMVHLIA